jgi:hypothetical protein
LQNDGDAIEIWYSKYIQCGGGATAIPVPLMEVIGNDLFTLPHRLPSNFEKWPAPFKPDYQEAFLAGMADKNVEVLEAARKLLNEKTVEATEQYCLAEGVPHSKQKLDEIIQAIKTLDTNKVTDYLGMQS